MDKVIRNTIIAKFIENKDTFTLPEIREYIKEEYPRFNGGNRSMGQILKAFPVERSESRNIYGILIKYHKVYKAIT